MWRRQAFVDSTTSPPDLTLYLPLYLDFYKSYILALMSIMDDKKTHQRSCKGVHEDQGRHSPDSLFVIPCISPWTKDASDLELSVLWGLIEQHGSLNHKSLFSWDDMYIRYRMTRRIIIETEFLGHRSSLDCNVHFTYHGCSVPARSTLIRTMHLDSWIQRLLSETSQ